MDRLIDQYISGHADRDCIEQLKQWSLESDAHRIYIRDRIELWYTTSTLYGQSQPDAELAFLRFKNRIKKQTAEIHPHKQQSFARYFWRIAAAVFWCWCYLWLVIGEESKTWRMPLPIS